MIRYSYSKKITSDEIIELYGAVGWIDKKIAKENGKSLIELAEDIASSFRNSQVVVSAREGGKLVGVIRGITDKIDVGLIVGLAVNPDFKRQGIGSKLLKKCIEKYPSIKWNLSSSSEAERFYLGQGFEENKEKGFSNGEGLF